MNQYAMRRLDRWVGRPLCRLLTAWRYAMQRMPARASAKAAWNEPPRKVLFVKLAEMGAIVLALPAFEAARRRVGRENMYCVVLAGNREIHELVDVFPSENLISIRDRNLWAFAVDCLRLRRRCRREGIDTVVDLEGFTRISALLSYFSGAARRVGLHPFTSEGPYRGDLFTHRVAYNPYLHTSRQFLAMVEAIDETPQDEPLLKRCVSLEGFELPRFRPTADDAEALEQLMASAWGSPPRRPWIVLNPNLVDLLPLRSWPRENFVALARRLLDACPEASLWLTGLPDEQAASQRLAAEIGTDRVVSMAGRTTLRTLVTLIDAADLLITSDSGPAHMASLTATPTITLFGPETPRLYGPLGPRQQALWAGLACSPCFTGANFRHSPCEDNACMRHITVEQVAAKAFEMCPLLSQSTAQTTE